MAMTRNALKRIFLAYFAHSFEILTLKSIMRSKFGAEFGGHGNLYDSRVKLTNVEGFWSIPNYKFFYEVDAS